MALSNSQYNKISAVYDERYYKRQHKLSQRILEVYNRIPEYKDIEDRLISLNVTKGRCLIFGETDKVGDIESQIDELIKQKQSLLCQHGFGVHYLDIPYECDICKDTGYVNNTPCQCFNKLASTMLCKETMTVEGYDKHSFDNFNFDLYSPLIVDPTLKLSHYDNAKKCVRKAKKFVSDFSLPYKDREMKNLFIFGVTGVGKTFLSNAIAKEIIEAGHKVMYISAPAMFELMSDHSYNRDNDSPDIKSKLNKIKNDDLLILDDLGTELCNAFTLAQLYSLINDRLIKGLSTIITSNIHFGEIKSKYDERIYSRIVGEYSLIKLLGKDLRLIPH